MIEDAELRELFQTESEEHLQSLDHGLLRLEANPQDSATLEEVFRAAHSLKGTARMLAVTGVETVAHHLEDELGSAKRGRVVLSPPVIDRLYAGLDAIRKLVDEAVSGTPAAVEVERVLGQLNGTVPLETRRETANGDVGNDVGPTEVGNILALENHDPPSVIDTSSAILTVTSLPGDFVESDVDESPSIEPTPPAAQVALAKVDESESKALSEENSDAQLAATNKGDFKIQTMRVPPAKLDALMTLASELTVTTNRVNRGLAAFVEMSELWEEWNRDVVQQGPLFNSLQNGTASNGAAPKSLAGFHEREQERLERLRALWQHVQGTVYDDVTRLALVADELEESIRNVRLLPLSTIFNLFPRAVRDLARDQHKEVQLLIEGGDTAADKRILEELKDPLMHMMRNAVDHGIELPDERQQKGKPRGATMRLRAYHTTTNVIVELQDDGRGLDIEAIKRTALKRNLHTEEELQTMAPEQIQSLIFAPGFSTSALVTDVSGRGVGLDVVRINVENLKGSIQVDSMAGAGSTFCIRLPLTLATTRVLLIEAEACVYALPIESVQGIMRVAASQFFTIEGRQTLVLGEEAIPVVRLSHLLQLKPDPIALPKSDQGADVVHICVVIAVGADKLGILVDALIDEQQVVMKPLGPMLKRVRNVAGSTILGAGEICMVLNPHDLVKSARQSRPSAMPVLDTAKDAASQQRKLILLAEDSITTRTQEKRILESAGYEVVTAVDGADAFQKLPTRAFDAVVSDVEMPNMDGLSLAARIRQNDKYKELPIILVTSLASDDDKRAGIEVGADAYITKGTFEQKVLLDTLRRLV